MARFSRAAYSKVQVFSNFSTCQLFWKRNTIIASLILLLITFMCNTFLQDTGGMTCFHLAARHGHTDLIKLLIKTGKFDIDQKVS